jgi:hypothetical protein
MPTQAPTGSTSRSRRGDGDLAAGAGLAGAGLDAHDALVDLGTSVLEELLDQAAVGARQDDLRAAGRLVDVLARRPTMRSPGRRDSRGTCSRAGQDRLGAVADLDHDVAALEAADDAGHELALAVLVLVEDVLALGLADALDDDLLGGLGGDAAEAVLAELQGVDLGVVLRLLLGALLVAVEVEDLEQELVADLGLETGAMGLLEADLAVPRLHLLDDVEDLEEVHVAGLGVEAGLDLPVLEDLLGGRRHSLLNSLDQDLARDVLLGADLLEHSIEVDWFFHGIRL